MPSEDGLPIPRRYWSILAIALAITMAVLDGAIANIALPTIARELHASPATSVWVINAYQLAITVSLLPLAALGEIVCYRRVFQVGLVVFTLASLGCALAPNLEWLAAARVLQGLGAAGIMSVNGALVRYTYPSRMLGRGVGYNALVVAVSAAIGPTVASGIMAVASWRWLFAVNVPIGVLTAVIALCALPTNEGAEHRFDWRSALASAVTLGLLMLGVESLTHGAGGWLGWAEIALAIVAGVVLVRREAPLKAPLVPIDLLRIPIFALSMCASVFSFSAQMLAFVFLPFFLQEDLHRSAVVTGLLITPWPIAVGIVGPVAGRLADRFPAGLLGGAGMVVFAGGLVALALLSGRPSDLDIIWRMAMCGAGFGLFQSPNNRTILSSASHRRSGAASGMLATARLLGQTLGATMVALIFRLGASGTPHWACGLAAILALAAAIASTLRLAHAVPAEPEAISGPA